MVSGDFFKTSGATTSYIGSFICKTTNINVTDTAVTITGPGEFSFQTNFPKVTVTIPRVLTITSAAPATVKFLSIADTAGAIYTCSFESPYFRTIEIEQDQVPEVTPFVSYNSGSLGSGGQARDLSIVAAYAEAGIEMLDTGGTNVIRTSEAGAEPNPRWSDAELHASMVAHFSRWRDLPQWKVWLLHALRYDNPDPTKNILGIMFDQSGAQRQGAAVFYSTISGAEPGKQRLQLYSCVHELGHCFNLYHSWIKDRMRPPMPNRPNALSYMNYPQRFPDGETTFWTTFPFQFDAEELMHLRHGFRSNVIMGGNPFGVGAGLENYDLYRNTLKDDSGLRLYLSGYPSFAFGEPVSIVLTLSTTDMRGKRVHSALTPAFGYVHFAIQKPDGRVLEYKSLLNRCIGDDVTTLDAANPEIKASIFLGYGKDGHYFDQPGFYKVRAVYYSLDGSEVLSNVLQVRVRTPLSADDENAADLLFGDDQGTLMYLLGSDAEELNSGTNALREAAEQYPRHRLAEYAQAVLTNNSAREFKIAKADNELRVRPSELDKESGMIVTNAFDARALDGGSDRGAENTQNVQADINSALRACAYKKVGKRATENGEAAMFRADAGFALALPAEGPMTPLQNFIQSRAIAVAREFAEDA